VEVGDLLRVRSVGLHRPDVGNQPALVEAAPDDARTVVSEEWTAIVSGNAGEALLPGTVGAHDVDVGEIARVGLELLRGRRVDRGASIHLANRGEHDPLAVGGIAGFGVVPARGRQPLQAARFLTVHVDIHLRVVIPRVAPLLAGRAHRNLLVLQLLRFGIAVRGGEENLVAPRTKKRARCLANAWRDPLHIAG
jgi:hypothetical protein